jgi:ubiquinone/menaquinone biosynthesis C-methylase UbiE
MRDDWDRRAREDAQYYVAFGRRKQSREEFFASAADVLRALKDELRRFPPGTDFAKLSALEIGCGPGRLMLPLSEVFGRIAGVDVSGEMIALARENLAAASNAVALQNTGADLSEFANESIDFCYSYAVFQHIPDKEVVWSYLREACRVLKKGGLLKFQVSGLPVEEQANAHPPRNGWSLRGAVPQVARDSAKDGSADTWQGVSFRPEELAHFAAGQNLQLLAMDGFDTQYLWFTARKPKAVSAAAAASQTALARIVQVTNTMTADAVVPHSGRYASASLWVIGLDELDETADLNSLAVDVDGDMTAPSFIGKHVWRGPTQVNFYLPPGVRSGIVPVSLRLSGRLVSNQAPMRVIGPGPWVPTLLGVSDGVNLLSQLNVASRTIKVNIEEVGVSSVEELLQLVEADVSGKPVPKIDAFAVDPLPRRYELNLVVPEQLEAGLQQLNIRVGSRNFPPVPIEISAN